MVLCALFSMMSIKNNVIIEYKSLTYVDICYLSYWSVAITNNRLKLIWRT